MRRRIACLGWVGSALLTSSTLTGVADAACGRADLEDAIPPDGAEGVPTNTPLSATYELGAIHQGEPVLVTRAGEPTQSLPAVYRSAVRTLTVQGVETLAPNSLYTVEWPGLSNDDSARPGNGAAVSFSVGGGPDNSRPEFDGIRELRWAFERKHDSCSATESERSLFELRLPEPRYSGGAELLNVLAFQTRGPNLGTDTAEQVYSRRYTGSNWITVKRPIAHGVGRVCFSAMFQAPNGMISGGAERSACA